MSNNEINKLFDSDYYAKLIKKMKVKKGDVLKIINYGSLACCNKELYLANNPIFPIYRTFLMQVEDKIEEYIDYDWNPDLIGKEYVVDYKKGLYIFTTTGEVLEYNQVEKIK